MATAADWVQLNVTTQHRNALKGTPCSRLQQLGREIRGLANRVNPVERGGIQVDCSEFNRCHTLTYSCLISC